MNDLISIGGGLAGTTNTTGGIRIDANCRVVRADPGGAIDGLYAAGTATGGFDGGPRAAHTGGIIQTVITAPTAAEDAAAATRKAEENV